MTLPARLSCGIAAIGLCATLGACNNDPGSGTLRVQYSFDSFTSCNEDAENVVDITVELGDDVATETVTCDNAGGEITISAPAGTYDIVVQGIDDVGDAVIDNLNDPITDDRVEVIGGDDKDFPVELGLIPARLEVIMQVINTGSGFPAMCGSTDIMIHAQETLALKKRLLSDEAAARQLRDPRLSLRSITDVMFDAGYQTKSSFNREFAQRMGTTPSEYRKRSLSSVDCEALPEGAEEHSESDHGV